MQIMKLCKLKYPVFNRLRVTINGGILTIFNSGNPKFQLEYQFLVKVALDPPTMKYLPVIRILTRLLSMYAGSLQA